MPSHGRRAVETTEACSSRPVSGQWIRNGSRERSTERERIQIVTVRLWAIHSRFIFRWVHGVGGRGLGGSGMRRMRGSRSGDRHCSGAAARGCFPHIEPRRGVPRDHAAMAGRASPTMANPRAPVPVFSQVGSAPPSTQARTHARGEAISPFRSLAPPARGPPRPQRAAVAAPVLPASATCRDSSSRVATTRKLTPA